MRLFDPIRLALKPNPGWIALAAALLLTAVGISAVGGSAHPQQAADQAVWLLISFGVMVVTLLPHPRVISLVTWPTLAIVMAMLVVLVVPGVPGSIVRPHHGVRGWINLHFMDFQPSEIAKILFVLALARYMRYRENYRTLSGLLAPFVIMFIPVILILQQPDLGTAVLFVPALFGVLIAAGARMSHIWTLIGLVAALILINVLIIFMLPDNMQILKVHQRNRIIAMVSLAKDESRFTKTTAYQQDMAKTLIGAGGITGYGLHDSVTLLKYNKLPEDYTDMVFAIIVNRWGMLGGLGVLVLYLVLIGAFLLVAGRSKDPYARLAVVGFAGLIAAQVVINMGMNVGLLPIIGITLPFVSYGGSSLLASYIMVGLVVNFAARRPQMLARPSFEFDNTEAIFQ